MGTCASMVLPAAVDATAGTVGKPRRTARWLERPHAVFSPNNFRGVVYTVLQSKDPASAAALVMMDVTVEVWRDRVKVRRERDGRGVSDMFKADPPIGLRDTQSGALLQLRHNGLLWGKPTRLNDYDRAVMVLWHFESAETISATLRPTFAAAEVL